MTTYRTLGTTDDVTDCQRDGCPKTGLRMTYHLGIIENDEVVGEVYYGSECAAMVTGKPAARIVKEARAADTKAAQERRDREYRARNVLDTYACLVNPQTREMKVEAAKRFWALNPAERRDVLAGLSQVVPGTEIAKRVTEAREVLPDYEPDMALHNPRTNTGSATYREYGWSCKCGRREAQWYGSLTDAETGARDDHDEMVRTDTGRH